MKEWCCPHCETEDVTFISCEEYEEGQELWLSSVCQNEDSDTIWGGNLYNVNPLVIEGKKRKDQKNESIFYVCTNCWGEIS